MDYPPARSPRSGDIQRNAMEPAGRRCLSSGPTHVKSILVTQPVTNFAGRLDYWNLITRHKFRLLSTTVCGVALALLVSLVQTPVS